jgi:CheY-like chemotaxis protein
MARVVLLVDDDPLVRAVAAEMLEDLVMLAANLATAISRIPPVTRPWRQAVQEFLAGLIRCLVSLLGGVQLDHNPK